MVDHDEKPPIINLVLEAPPETASPTAGVSGSVGLVNAEAMALIATKFVIVESLLKLIPRPQNYGDFTREILLCVMKVVKCEAGSLLEVDHARSVLIFRSVVGTVSDQVPSFEVPLGKGIVGHVAETRRPHVVSNVNEDKLHLKAIRDATGFDARNIVAVPMVIRGQVYGVLELLNRVDSPGFSEADVELLTYACEMASKAIEARLMINWALKQKESASNEAA